MKKRQEERAVRSSDSLAGGQLGLTLIETLIALAILAAVGGVFLAGMTTSSRAVIIGQEQVTGESLAKSQMEAIKLWAYDDDNNPPTYEAAKLTDIPVGYTINIAAERLEANPNNDPAEDDGLQKITITITRGEKTVFTLEGYKCFIGQ
jgi:type II secretory pathway pseudopilin PulG